MTGLSGLATELEGRYRIERELGAGGMAVVYLAFDLRHQRQVAIKVMRDDIAEGVSRGRFLREIGIAAKIQHPHVVPLFDSGVAGGLLYYVMPFVDGESLRDRLTRTPQLPLSDAVRILRDIADALSEAHEHGVVHRDLKPENVLLRGASAVVADFGIAKAFGASTTAGSGATITRAGNALGTPAYMAPEQISADPTLDHRADLYSWGCVAYEVLTGAAPFADANVATIFTAHLTATPTPIESRRPGVPPSLANIVHRALAKDPDDRPQSASEILASLAMTASEGSRPARARGATSRFALLAGVAAALMLIGVVAITRMRVKSVDALDRSVVVVPFDNAAKDSTQEYFSDGLTDELVGRLAAAGLRVTGRNTAYSLKGRHVAAQEAGRIAGVATVLTGQVRRLGGQLHVTAELARASDGFVIWSYSFDRPSHDVFVVQREIADSVLARFATVSNALRVHAGAAASGTMNVQAHDVYLRARFVAHTFTRDGLNAAVAVFDSAIALDPRYAEAYVGKALAISWLGDGYVAPLTVLPRALEALHRGREIDSTLAEGWGAAAVINTAWEWDWPRARDEIRHARAIDPLQPSALLAEYFYRNHSGDLIGGLAVLDTLARLDPLDPIVRLNHMFLYALTGNSDSVRAVWGRLPDFIRNVPFTDVPEGVAMLAMGRNAEAERAFHDGERGMGKLSPGRGVALARLGRVSEARGQLAAISRAWPDAYSPPELIAAIPAALGDTAGMYHWLDTAVRERSGLTVTLGYWGTELGAHRREPHFQAILQTVGVTSPTALP